MFIHERLQSPLQFLRFLVEFEIHSFAYLPVNFGARFSTKCATPSLKS
jgi:hypothetical protein